MTTGFFIRSRSCVFARHVNFSVGEIKRLIDGLPGRPPPERWRKLAAGKLEQIDALIARAKRVRKMLGDTLLHECPMRWNEGDALLSRSRQDQEGRKLIFSKRLASTLSRRSPFSIPDIHGIG